MRRTISTTFATPIFDMRKLLLATLWWVAIISPAVAQYQPGTQFFPISATDTNYAQSFKKYLYSFALPQPAIGVVGIGGYVALVSQTNAFSVALISIHFSPSGNCPTDGSVYDSYAQIAQTFPETSQIAQFIVKSPEAAAVVVPTQILLPAPIAVRGCIILILDGGNPAVGGMLKMISGMSLAYIPGPVPPSTSVIPMDDEFCLVQQNCGQLSVVAPSLQTAFAKVVPITQAATLVALYGNIGDSALGPVGFAPPPNGPWTTSNDYYIYPGCGGMSAGTVGPGDYYATIPANAIHLTNVTMQSAGDTAQHQLVSQSFNQPLAAGDCLVHLFRSSANGAFDAESQVFALTTPP
jgi:hypothetical protein